jgi:hypothetical protein
LVEIGELSGGFEAEGLAFGRGGAGEELIEDVIIALGFGLVDEARAFEEVGSDAGANNGLRVVKEDLLKGEV